MRLKARKALAVTTGAAVLLAGVGLAGADEVVNDVPVVSSVRQATIVSAGAGVEVKYKIAHSDDPADAPACDAQTNQHGGPVTVTPQVPTGVSPSLTSVSFTSEAECTNGTQKAITFTSSTPGSYSIGHHISWIAKQGNNRTMDNAANFTLNVRPRPAGVLTATGGNALVDLSWLPSPDANHIGGYEVSQGGDPIGTVTGTTRQVTGLTNGTEYCFTVKAFTNVANGAVLFSDANTPACATPVAPMSPKTGAFLEPVNGNGTINIVKQGRVVPVKIEISDATGELKTGPVTFTQRKASCDNSSNSDPVNEAAGSSNSGNEFRFVTEAGGDWWQYNLATRNLTLGCTTFDVLHDGQVVAQFILNVTK